MTVQQAFTEFQSAKADHKTARDAYKQAMENNKTLADLAEAKKQAAAEYKAEREQFDGSHAALVEKIAELNDEAKAAKTLFDETVEIAVRAGEQLSLFDVRGREVSVQLTTKITIEKDVKKADAEPADADEV